MENLLKKLFPKLFCNHSYKLENSHLDGNCGSRKVFYYICEKCGKQKTEFI